MADESVSSVIKSTCDSASSLRSTLLAVPALESSSLTEQLQVTVLVCREVQKRSERLRLDSSESSFKIVQIIKHIGKKAQDVKDHIQESNRTSCYEWNTFKVQGMDIAAISNLLQIYTSSVFVGAVGLAMLVNDTWLAEKRTKNR